MSTNYTGRVITILVVLLIALVGFPGCGDEFHGIFTFSKLFNHELPWSQTHNLKPGIDIAGGTKLLYEIKPPPGGYAGTGGTLAEQVAASLKRRVDPDGVKNLVWRPQGDTRLEIQLPRTLNSDKSLTVKKELTSAQEALDATNVSPGEVLAAINLVRADDIERKLFAAGPVAATPATPATKAAAAPAPAATTPAATTALAAAPAATRAAGPADPYQAKAADRQARLDKLVQGSKRRSELFNDLAQQHDAYEFYVVQARHAGRGTNPWSQWLKYQFATLAARSGAAFNTTLFPDLKARAAGVPPRPVTSVSQIADAGDNAVEQTNLSAAQLQNVLDTQDTQERLLSLGSLQGRFADFPARLAAMTRFEKAYADLKALKGAIGDASDLKRLLRGSGVLEFHILVEHPEQDQPEMLKRLAERGPAPQAGDESRWYLLDRQDGSEGSIPYHTWNGKKYALSWITPDKSMVHRTGGANWALQRAYPTQGQSGGRIVGFEFDPQGAALFGKLTGDNLHKPLATILDDKIITAPTIKSQIFGSGTIDGGQKGYTQGDLDYLIGTLNAGSLPAQLSEEPISEQTITPTFGEANLRSALYACLIGLVVVGVFLVGYYYLAGVVAFAAVLMNVVIILGVLAMFNATFTLPSIAGIVLTVGTAIDANVLIFERLREEQHRGLSIKMATRNAFDRARSAIIDSNATTIITSAILYMIGTEEVKGFGLTLLIGIFSSLFTALFVTKTIMGILIDRHGVKELGSLPQTFPKWDRLLKPNINWMGMVWPFVTFSAIFIGIGLSAFVVRYREMYDVEFTKGTEVEFELKSDVSLEKVQKMIADADARSHALPSAGVVGLGGSQRRYEVVTPNDNAVQVRAALEQAFGDLLAVERGATFENEGVTLEAAMSTAASATPPAAGEKAAGEKPAVEAGVPARDVGGADAGEAMATVVPIEKESLLVDGVTVETAGTQGGVGIVLRGLEPRLRPSEIKDRINRAALQSGGQQRVQRVDVAGLGPKEVQATDTPTDHALVMMTNPDFSYHKNPADWKENLARPGWKLVNEGLTTAGSLGKVNNFDAQVAAGVRTMALAATVASIVIIMAYIWFRFGDLKYGTATVVALLHDTLAVIGAIGISHYLSGTWFGNALLVEPFRINLTLVAAILTVMGYSMIDTIVVFDRIRENRGKFGVVTRQVINDSVNQTLSRTLLTAGTTLIMVTVMYIAGGPGIHGFTFVLLAGILFGTYSSIAIAAPILLVGKQKGQPHGPRKETVVVQPATPASGKPPRLVDAKGPQRA